MGFIVPTLEAVAHWGDATSGAAHLAALVFLAGAAWLATTPEDEQ